ncbi:hypothetical protein [Salinimicrobium sediminilitoris]|uniref:hypothetical protein n=1 Tax=Salinimicrobium sediminilitoris TaxID=2876715 RepID=UPI001E4D139A|nr:hypothetical protein [Salinimicrobium sediminilitoris]MCC8360335.1 hypothetical protein [Salinimicrobium sediminilitoris]
MKLEEAIQRLDRSTGVPGSGKSVKIKQRFSNILQEVKYKDLPPEQLALLEQELDSIFSGVDLQAEKVEKYLRLRLEGLLKFLRKKFALVPEGYCAMNGMRFGLAAGFVLLLVLLVFIDSVLKYYSPLSGLLLGVMVGSICDRRRKARGKALLTRMV